MSYAIKGSSPDQTRAAGVAIIQPVEGAVTEESAGVLGSAFGAIGAFFHRTFSPWFGGREIEPFGLANMPSDLLFDLINKYGLAVQEIALLRGTCQGLNALLQDELIWGALYRRDFKHCKTSGPTFQESYRKAHDYYLRQAKGVYSIRRCDLKTEIVATTGKKILLVAEKGIEVLDINTFKCLHTIPGAVANYSGLVADGQYLAALHSFEEVKVWGLEDGLVVNFLSNPSIGLVFKKISLTDDKLVLAYENLIEVIDLKNRFKRLKFHDQRFLHASGDKLFSVSHGTITLLDSNNGGLIQTFQMEKAQDDEDLISAAVGAGRLAVGSSKGKIRIWELETGKSLSTLQMNSEPVLSLVFDGKHLITRSRTPLHWHEYSDAFSIAFWELETGRCLFMLPMKTIANSFLTIHDAKLIVHCEDDTIRIFDFQAPITSILSEIAFFYRSGFENPRSGVFDADSRYYNLPRKIRDQIDEKLRPMLLSEGKVGRGEATIIQKAQAIEEYLKEQLRHQ